MKPTLYIVIPCYNEQEVLPIMAPVFLKKLLQLKEQQMISQNSRVLFVNDGSSDNTWNIINNFAKNDEHFTGVSLSRNRGHQNALLAGLIYAMDKCDITISIDCDGQDDINAMDQMVKEYLSGADIVYGVRDSRKKDSFFKRTTAQLFYKFINKMGAETVYNHADYRLLSNKVLKALSEYKEVNIYLRGMIPLIGFKSTCVKYERNVRKAGKSHYPLGKMLSLALNAITSLSVKPIHLITIFGFVVALVSAIGIVWSIIVALTGNSVVGWSSTVSIICFLGGIQLVSLGIIGEYIGKIYLESKARPRYIISETTENESEQCKK